MRVFLVAIALAATGVSSAASSKPPSTKPAAGLVTVKITSARRQHVFKAEVARTPEEQSRGLMFRTRLAPDRAMIFPMATPRYASFWMKNTLIPLDMIFIRSDGTIARIAPMTVPKSLAPVSSGEPVVAVLEIAGGRAAQLGISENDRVAWPR